MKEMNSYIDVEEIKKSFLYVKPGEVLSEAVYLVYPDVCSFHGLPYHAGIASIAAVLQEADCEVKVGYLSSESQYTEIVEAILEFQPSVVGFTTVETQFGYVQELAALIKEKHPCVTVVGGTHITLWPQSMLEKGSVALDCGMRGECEEPFLELVRKVAKGDDYHNVNNVCYKDPKSGGLVENPLRPLIQDLTCP